MAQVARPSLYVPQILCAASSPTVFASPLLESNIKYSTEKSMEGYFTFWLQ